MKKDEEIDAILESAVPLNTRRAADTLVSIINAFCAEAKLEVELATCSGVGRLRSRNHSPARFNLIGQFHDYGHLTCWK